MSYLNRFIIDEECQFECQGVYDLQELCKAEEMRRMVQSSAPFNGHVILADDFSNKSRLLWPMLENFSAFCSMINFVGSERLECVNKRRCEQFYSGGGLIAYNQSCLLRSSEVCHLRSQKSIGDDIEDFFEWIKSKKIKGNFNKTFYAVSDILDGIYSSKMHQSAVSTFHLTMLSEHEASKLAKRVFKKYPDYKEVTRLSNDEHNYALSVCFRKTWIGRKGKFYETNEPVLEQLRKLEVNLIKNGKLPDRYPRYWS